MKHSHILKLAIFFSFTVGLAQADKIDGRLSAARRAFFASQAEFRSSVLEWFDAREKRARKKGDRTAVVALLEEREKFTSEDTLPQSAPQDLPSSLETARAELSQEYASAVSTFTRRSLDDRASAAEEQLRQILAGELTDKPRSVWLYDGGFFEQTENKTWREVAPDGVIHQLSETRRTSRYVELHETEGDSLRRVRLFEDHADLATADKEDFAKAQSGRWHTLTAEATTKSAKTASVIREGMEFRGDKIWTKKKAVFKRGTKQWHVLKIESVSGQHFTGSVDFKWGKSPVAIEGMTDGYQIQWANVGSGEQAYFGTVDKDRITAISFNGTIALELQPE